MTQNKSSVHDIIDRMKAALNVSKDVDLAAHLGVGQPSVWKKRGSVPMNVCVSFAIERGISLDWLVLGRGERSSEAEREMGETKESSRDDDYVDVPMVDMPALPSVDETHDIWWRVPRATLEAFGVGVEEAMVMRVLGEANFGAFRKGDVVLVDRRSRDVDGVFVLRFGDRVRVKRVQAMSDGSVKLSSDSELYESEYVSADAFESMEVIGFCAGVLSRLY